MSPMTEVALVPDTAPRPPAVILQLLEKLGVPCHIRPDHPALAASRRVQAALLDDALGALLVLFVIKTPRVTMKASQA